MKKFEQPIKNEEKIAKEKSRERRKNTKDTTCNDRDLEDYEKELRISATKEFLGEKVLDLGCGKKALFAREAAKRGIQVYPLNPDLSYKKYRNLLKKGAEKGKKEFFTAGLAQELPYKSNVFDSVLSMWAVPYYIKKDEKEQEDVLREIIRVLKPGGKAFLSPVYEERVPFVEKAIKKIKEENLAAAKLVEGVWRGVSNVVLIKTKEK